MSWRIRGRADVVIFMQAVVQVLVSRELRKVNLGLDSRHTNNKRKEVQLRQSVPRPALTILGPAVSQPIRPESAIMQPDSHDRQTSIKQ